MQNKNVQIPYELFFQLLQYFLMDNYDGEEIIRLGLEKKLDAMVNREVYSKSKTAPTEEEREKFPAGISGQTGNTGELRCKVLSDYFITGACHAPVDSRQVESW